MTTIEIKSKQTHIRVLEVLTNSPEIEVFLEENATFPTNISSGETLRVKVVVTPQNTARFDGLVMIVFESRIYVMSVVSTLVSPNKFGLRPLYFGRVMHRQEVSHPLVIANPSSSKIYIEEFYMTNGKFKADFKRGGG